MGFIKGVAAFSVTVPVLIFNQSATLSNFPRNLRSGLSTFKPALKAPDAAIGNREPSQAFPRAYAGTMMTQSPATYPNNDVAWNHRSFFIENDMARHETDREDLMREATALCERVELAVPTSTEPVYVGFRETGTLSVYFGVDAAFHFDSAGRLRRAFVDGLLYRSQGKTLARLTRSRTRDETQLQRHDLSPEELREFCERVRGRLALLEQSLTDDTARIVSVIPAGTDLRPRIATMLELILSGNVPLSPPIKGRRVS